MKTGHLVALAQQLRKLSYEDLVVVFNEALIVPPWEYHDEQCNDAPPSEAAHATLYLVSPGGPKKLVIVHRHAENGTTKFIITGPPSGATSAPTMAAAVAAAERAVKDNLPIHLLRKRMT